MTQKQRVARAEYIGRMRTRAAMGGYGKPTEDELAALNIEYVELLYAAQNAGRTDARCADMEQEIKLASLKGAQLEEYSINTARLKH